MTGAKNADFDGDEENATLAGDKKIAKMINTLDLCYSYLGMGRPFEASGLIAHSKPLTASMACFLEG